MSAIFGETLVFGQQDGPDIELVVYGDEFYARYETPSGYTVIYDLDLGCYCYAELKDGLFESSTIPIRKRPPFGLRKRLKESHGGRNEKFRSRYKQIRPPEPIGETNVLRTLGPASGLLTGRQVSTGSVKGLTILVEFSDLKSQITNQEIAAMLNDLDYSANGNLCSIKKYYQLMSTGKLTYDNDVVGPITLSKKQSHYINNPLMAEALELAVKEYHVELSKYDSKNQGIVDALSFLYAGRTLYKNWLWPHNSFADLTYGSVSTHYYTIQSLGRRAVDVSIGTFAHESGHMLCRYPDLYDYGERDGDFEQSAGLGVYCLMSAGNHLNGGKSPSPICAYLRDLSGWCDQEISLNEGAQYTAKHGDYPTVMRFSTDKPNEYFLVENRSQLGLDAQLVDSGLAVYHCDTRGSNEYQDGTPDKHYQCALLQADGHLDLENDVNQGDKGDLYNEVNALALDYRTRPSSKEWDGTDSGFAIRAISKPGVSITFITGESKPTNRIEASAAPDLIIPDDNPDGIVSSVTIDRRGVLRRLFLRVDISHTYRGDLQIDLVSPKGTKARILSQKYDTAKNVHIDFNSDEHSELKRLNGESINGLWRLEVKDLVKDDVGRLDKWSLVLEYDTTEKEIKQEVSPHLVIPDAAANGVTSDIDITATGRVVELGVVVDISHSFTGDLHIELVAPSGHLALLRAADGKYGKDVHEIYTLQNTPSLQHLVGEDARGKWKLFVRDFISSDEGTLDRWKLDMLIE